MNLLLIGSFDCEFITSDKASVGIEHIPKIGDIFSNSWPCDAHDAICENLKFMKNKLFWPNQYELQLLTASITIGNCLSLACSTMLRVLSSTRLLRPRPGPTTRECNRGNHCDTSAGQSLLPLKEKKQIHSVQLAVQLVQWLAYSLPSIQPRFDRSTGRYVRW